MTFCIAMKIEEGLVGIADTRITSGTECITANKVSIHEYGSHSMFFMTSGLRSVRDKAITYFNEMLAQPHEPHTKLYEAVNAFAGQLRRVMSEDLEVLENAGLHFNLHCLIGGQLEHDEEHKLYLLYPQGNWVEVHEGTPYYAIGESAYGKPLLDSTLTYQTDMKTALKIGYLAFDATRCSTVDVNFPMDVVLYQKGQYKMVQHRFERQELLHVDAWWRQERMKVLETLPSEWTDIILSKFPKES